MSWEDQLRPASFRGVGFLVDSHSTKVGRRRARHVYPRRDLPFFEDLGGRPQPYSIDAYVLGDEYMAARDALLRACREEGPGTLIHPYLGQATVICSSCRERERVSEGRMARFSLTFEQAGAQRFPDARPDTRGRVRGASDAAILAAEQDFAGAFKATGKPEFVAKAAENLAGELLDEIEAGAGRTIADPNRWAEFTRDTAELRGDLPNLVRDPAALASSLTGNLKALGALPADSGSALPALRPISTFGDTLLPVPSAPASRIQQGANQGALVALVRRSVVAESARAAAGAEFEAYDDAIAIRGELTELLDGEILAAGDSGDDAAFRSLTDLLVAVSRDLNERALGLPRIEQRRLTKTLPSSAFAYALYGDAARAEEIVARNKIRHPGFVPGGVDIRVLAA